MRNGGEVTVTGELNRHPDCIHRKQREKDAGDQLGLHFSENTLTGTLGHLEVSLNPVKSMMKINW